MPQVGDDVALDQVPDRCGYAFSPGWAYVLAPEHEVEVQPEQEVPNPNDPENPIVIPAVTQTVPAQWASTPPLARVLKLGLVPADVMVNPGPLVAELEAQVQSVRDAWGCPDEALVLVAYRFEV